MDGSLVLLAVVLAVCGLLIGYTLKLGISPMPSSPAQREAVLALIPPDTTGTIVELGAGWGGLAFALAARFPRCTVVAYELSVVPWGWLRLRRLVQARPNLVIRRQDFTRASLAEASVLVSYLFTAGMQRLAAQLEREGRPGALWVSHTFGVRGWKPVSERTLDDLHRTHVYAYRVPEQTRAPPPVAV